MFKKQPTKAELRRQLNAQVSQFLEKGGHIQEVAMGETGLIDGRYTTHRAGYGSPKSKERTPVHGLLAKIDSRRKRRQTVSTASRHKPPKKKVIYDDFGEPIRTVWADE